jgi:hypothetical protein
MLWSFFWLVMGFALGGSFVSLSEVPINPLALTTPAFIAGAVCFLSLVFLVVLVGLIWNGRCRHCISEDCFGTFRMGLTTFAAICAIVCAWRLICNVAIPMKLDPGFVPELIAYSIFWVLVPPIWFFVEYFAVQTRWIRGLPANQYRLDEKLKEIKDYADYASKIWAGVLALLVALIAMKK